MPETNYVIEGKHASSQIFADEHNYVFIGYSAKNPKVYFDKKNVKSIEKVNEESSLYKETVSFWLGSVAAAGVSDLKDIIILVEWVDGNTSMLKITQPMYTNILATKMIDVAEYKHQQQLLSDYKLACKYQENKKFEEAKKLFEELSRENFWDSQSHLLEVKKELAEIQNKLDIVNSDPQKDLKLQLLRGEYKKFSIISLVLSILLFPLSFYASVVSAIVGTLFMHSVLLSVGICGALLSIGYLLMFFTFKIKVTDNKALNDAYNDISLNGGPPKTSFKQLTITFAVIAIILMFIFLIF